MPREEERVPEEQAQEAAETTAAVPIAAAAPVAQDPVLAAAEADLVRRYPDHQIKQGSLCAAAGARPRYGHKRTVTLHCVDCGAERVVATSDLFHVRRCEECARKLKKQAKKSNKP